MKKLQHFLVSIGVVSLLTSCGSTQYLEAFSPEESSLNLVKITDESTNSVLAASRGILLGEYGRSRMGISKTKNYAWYTNRLLAISPDGKKLAYVTRMNKQDNIMVRNTTTQSVATQRTFRNVHSFSWGDDNRLYFSDFVSPNNFICAVNADAGSMMDQITNGNVTDTDPVFNSETNQLFFVRTSTDGPSVWSVNRKDGTLTACARGYSPCLIPGNPNAFYCVRNTDAGKSEIWYVDFVKGQESLILSDVNHSFTNPTLSPDGKWLAVVGNSDSSISKSTNLDIFVVRVDGSRLTQLTYHPSQDTNPVWARDGRSIFFISSRANKDNMFNVWRMNFDLE